MDENPIRFIVINILIDSILQYVLCMVIYIELQRTRTIKKPSQLARANIVATSQACSMLSILFKQSKQTNNTPTYIFSLPSLTFYSWPLSLFFFCILIFLSPSFHDLDDTMSRGTSLSPISVLVLEKLTVYLIRLIYSYVHIFFY